MKCHAFIVLLLSHVFSSLAVKISVKQQSKTTTSNFRVLAASDNNSLDINTAQDLIYMANITVGGNSYIVQLDTGSSDLWIKGNTFPLPNGNPTTVAYNVTYGIGWAYGNVSYADVEFAGISVKSQGFLDVSQAQNPALGYGADGILGLGFTSLSTVDALVNSTGSSQGRSLLYNLFEDNPSEPNFIAFALQRTKEDNQDDVEGSFSIGEYEPAYASIANTTAIPTWPEKSPKRWSVLVEALLIGDKTITPTTHVPDVPSNRAVVVLDTGTSYSYVPKEICDAIYSGINGASFDPIAGQWTVPCNVEVDMAIQIGGRTFPVHPLDVTPKNIGSSSVCVGSFVPQTFSSSNQFDWLVGDNFLRSVYSIYDFGDFDSNHQMGDPYVKLLSLTNPDEASSEFAKARGTTAKTGITYNASNATAAAADSTSVTLSAEVANTISKIGTYFPAILGLIALNAVVMVTLLIAGIVFLCQRRRKRRTRVTKGRTPARLTPMPMNSGDDLPPEGPHVYQPVSMAMSEDTFVPPLASLRKHSFGGDNRPTSVATLPSHKMYDIAEGGPPSGFKEFSPRPQSVAVFGVQHRASTSSSVPLNGPTPEDEPFVPPRSSPRAPSVRSYHSQQSDSPNASGIPMQEFPPSSPGGPDLIQPHTPVREVPTLSGVTLTDAPVPRSFNKNEPRGFTLTDVPVPRPFVNSDPRPMSVGTVPSAEFAHPRLPPRRAAPSVPVPEAPPMAEEDITLAPPNPFFRRGGDGPSADRPRSVA